jgi:hypothetical protein
MDKKLAKYFRESSEDFQTRAKDILFSYQCEDGDTKQLLEDAMNLIADVQDFFHHIAIV